MRMKKFKILTLKTSQMKKWIMINMEKNLKQSLIYKVKNKKKGNFSMLTDESQLQIKMSL